MAECFEAIDKCVGVVREFAGLAAGLGTSLEPRLHSERVVAIERRH